MTALNQVKLSRIRYILETNHIDVSKLTHYNCEDGFIKIYSDSSINAFVITSLDDNFTSYTLEFSKEYEAPEDNLQDYHIPLPESWKYQQDKEVYND